VLVAPNDFVSLGHAIAELAGDRNKLASLGKRARSRVQTLFNAQHVSEQMRGHYQSVLAR